MSKRKKEQRSMKEKQPQKQKRNNAIQNFFLKKTNNIDKHQARMVNIKGNNHSQVTKNNFSLQTLIEQKGNIANNL